MVYIVDIDNTICETHGNDYPNSKPIYYRINEINNLYEAGHTINYWTARGSSSGINWLELTIQQLNEWGVKHHSVNVGKPSYDIWIDDKSINPLDL